jgi:tetratricopeptide (TPR) repeat protein
VIADLGDRGALVRPGDQGCGLVLELIEREERRFVDSLSARAWWASLKGWSPDERLAAIQTLQPFQTRVMFDTILAEAASIGPADPDAGEETARFALAIVEVLRPEETGPELQNDLRAEAWAVLGNCRRIVADWQGAANALSTARSLLDNGTADPLAEARLLSIEASLAVDTGRIDRASHLLDRARRIYAEVEDWPAVAKVAVQQANALRETAPDEAYRIAGEALRLSSGDRRLEMLARSIRTEALLERGATREALRNHAECRELYNQFPEPRIQLRVRFIEARLLEALDCPHEAEKLYEEVAESFHKAELHRDMFMTRLHLFGFHLSQGAVHRAAEVCRESLAAMESAGPVHAQMRQVWADLLQHIEHRRVDVELLRSVREYMARHWLVPAPRPPLATLDVR